MCAEQVGEPPPGVDLKTARARMGHSNPALTLAIYARATDDTDRAAAEAVGERRRPRDGRFAGADIEPGAGR